MMNEALEKASREPRAYSLEQLSHETSLAQPDFHDGSTSIEDSPWDPELRDALELLSPRLREAVLLDTELTPKHRSVREIAEILGISRVAAHMRLKRAYVQLREILPDHYLELRKVRRRGQEGLEGS